MQVFAKIFCIVSFSISVFEMVLAVFLVTLGVAAQFETSQFLSYVYNLH